MLYLLVLMLLLSIAMLKKPVLTNIKEYPLPFVIFTILSLLVSTKTDIGPLEFVLSFCVLWVLFVLSYSFGYYVGLLYERLNKKLKAHNSATIAVFEWLKNEQGVLVLILIITIYFTM